MSGDTYRIFANGKDTGLIVSDEGKTIKVSAMLEDAYHVSDVLTFTISDVREGIYDNIVIDDQKMIINCNIDIRKRIFTEKPQFVFNTYIKNFDEHSERTNFFLKNGNKELHLNDNGEFVFVGREMALDWQICYRGKYNWSCTYKNHVVIVTDRQDKEQIQIIRFDPNNNSEHLCDDAFALRFTITNTVMEPNKKEVGNKENDDYNQKEPQSPKGMRPSPIDTFVTTYIHTTKQKIPYTLFFQPSKDYRYQYEALLILPEEYRNVDVEHISFFSKNYSYKTIDLNGKLKKNVTIPVEIERQKNFFSRHSKFKIGHYTLFVLLLCLILSALQIIKYKINNDSWSVQYTEESQKVRELKNIVDTLVCALGAEKQEWPNLTMKTPIGITTKQKISNISILKEDTLVFDYKNSCSWSGKLDIFIVGSDTIYKFHSTKEKGHFTYIFPSSGVYNTEFVYYTDTCGNHSVTIKNIRLKRNKRITSYLRQYDK